MLAAGIDLHINWMFTNCKELKYFMYTANLYFMEN